MKKKSARAISCSSYCCKNGNWHLAAATLIAIGAVNWGLIAIFNLNLVNLLLGSWPMVEKLVYIVIGLAGVYKLYVLSLKCR